MSHNPINAALETSNTVGEDKSPIQILDQHSERKTPQPQPKSRLLNLPAELRNQIYNYIFTSHTIEVYLAGGCIKWLSHWNPVLVFSPARKRLLFRIEWDDETRWRSVENDDGYAFTAEQKPSLHALFPLANVCRQTRAEATLLLYEGNTFAFTHSERNYSAALQAWLSSLTPKERGAIRSLAWPRCQAREFVRNVMWSEDKGLLWKEDNGPLGSLGRECLGELAQLSGLKHVLLRMEGSGFDRHEFKGKELEEWEQAKAKPRDSNVSEWQVTFEFRQMLAAKGMRGQIGREDVRVDYQMHY